MKEVSRVSIGFGAPKSADKTTTENVSNINNKNEQARYPESRTFDNALCLCFYCIPHQKILLRRTVKREIFLPFKFFSPDRPWLQVSKATFEQVIIKLGAKKFMQNLSEPEMLDLLGADFPFNNRYYNRITMLSYYNPSNHKGASGGKLKNDGEADVRSRLSAAENLASVIDHNKEEKQAKPDNTCLCECLHSSFVWMNMKQIETRMNNKFWGPEPLMFLKTLNDTGTFGERFELSKSYKDIPIFNCLSVKKDNPKIKNMLHEAKYSQKIIIRLYNEFICHCYPSRFMTLLSFKIFMQKFTNWNTISNDQYENIFRALDFRQTNYLTFEELLLGFTAMDTMTPHSGINLEIRCGYIFRMYKRNRESKVFSAEDMKLLSNDLSSSVTDKATYELTNATLQSFMTRHFSKANGLTNEEFITAICESKDMTTLTTTIFRSPFSLLITITTRFDFHVRIPNIRKDKFYSKLTESLSVHYHDSCIRCKMCDYQISSEVHKISAQGEILEKMSIEKDPKNSKFQFSVDTPEPLLAEMLKNIRLTNEKPNENWHFESKKQLLNNIKVILERARDVITQDQKIKPVCAPAVILPGTKGILSDLLTLENYFWRSTTSDVIISGNFIDVDSSSSVYCFIYLLCLKINRPNRFLLLRGSNESWLNLEKIFNQHFNGQNAELVKILETIFEQLPVAAVIEEQIFVSAGGIPKSLKSLDSLRKNISTSGKVTFEVAHDLIHDMLEEVPKNSPLWNLESNIKSPVDVNKQYTWNISLNLFNQFRHQNSIKLCIVTHCRKKISPTIKFEFDCRLISLSTSECNAVNGRIISGALVGYDRIRLFEISTRSGAEANRKCSDNR